MRSTLVLLATLAASVIAHPADVSVDAAVSRRNLDLGIDIGANVVADIGGALDAVLSLGVDANVNILAGLEAHAAAALQGGALGCKSSAIKDEHRKQLKAWLNAHAEIRASLKAFLPAIIGWCEGSVSVLEADVLAALAVYIPGCAEIAAKESLYVTIDGIFDSAKLAASLVLKADLQAKLNAKIAAAAELDVNVKAGLHACAAGGLVTGLSAEVKAGLVAWLKTDACVKVLGLDLKAAIEAWVNAKVHVGLVAAGSISADALSAISVGAAVGAAVEEKGGLSVSAKASIKAFLDAKVAVNLSDNVKLALQAAARGDLAASLKADVRTDLAIWLAGKDCSLGVELKAVVLLWLSVAASAEVSVDLVTGLLGDITGFLTETVIAGLSLNLRGALGLLKAGESLTVLSWETRAELAAFLGGCTSIKLDLIIEIIIQWFTGCQLPGAPAPSSVPSLPSSTPTVSIPVGVSSTGSAPTGPATTGPATTGAASSPAGPAPSGTSPCRLLRSGVSTGSAITSAPAPTAPAVTGATTLSTTTITRMHTVYACK
ncbi:hypothetical protein N7512_006174 [Penicillium capsulatum]|nr:hypothetical protein N7512_006174 [Penicillium capsulatum]